MLTRRTFCLSATAALLAPTLHAQTHLNLAEIDRTRIEQAAKTALARPELPFQTLDSEAFLNLTVDLPALAAAHLLSPAPALQAKAQSRLAQLTQLPTSLTAPESASLLAPLAETAVALPFLNLAASPAQTWFAAVLTDLTTSRTALLARDSRDHNASSWLLLVAALARLLNAEAPLTEARHRYKSSTIRSQIDANGLFPAELLTPNPFRNSLFNLDLLAGASNLLSTPFDSVWTHELPDGPGMRAAISRHAPYIARPGTWPYPADETHFRDLPCRRPALLFAARAFNQANYATQWRNTAPAEPSSPEVLRTFPIRQPILWLPQTHRS